MRPEFFIEALGVWLNGCTGSERRDRSALLPSFLVVPWGLGKLALAILGVDVGYGVVLILDDFLPLAATRASEDVLTPSIRMASSSMFWKSS